MEKAAIQAKWDVLSPMLDERARRLWAAAEAKALGHGGITLLSEVTGLSRMTIHTGTEEVRAMAQDGVARPLKGGRIRAEGAGRKRLADSDPTLLKDLDLLVDPVTRGDPMNPLRWTSKSTAHLAEALRQRGHKVSWKTVARMLTAQGYSLQANRKTKESEIHPDRDQQFSHINKQAKEFQSDGQPVISVDTKKKELIGEYKNGGQEWQPKGKPEHVSDHDFPNPEVPKAVPYGIYDVGANQGWVTVGTDHDTLPIVNYISPSATITTPQCKGPERIWRPAKYSGSWNLSIRLGRIQRDATGPTPITIPHRGLRRSRRLGTSSRPR